MTEDSKANYVSVIGSHFLWPIATLANTMVALPANPPNEVQCSAVENGYATAIIVLATCMIESAVARARYLRSDTGRQNPVDFVAAAYPDSGFETKLKELFAVRDTIAHAHIWEAQIKEDQRDGLRLANSRRLPEYGDRKYRGVLNEQTRCTRKLQINLFPNRICGKDAAIVLRVTYDLLSYIEDRQYGILPVRTAYAHYGLELLSFEEIVERLERLTSDSVRVEVA